MDNINVLSLFDGMSCGQIALNKIGIKYNKYFASEIDNNVIKITQHNYPNTVQLGDITKIKGTDLPKIELLIGGSPCQGFSFAGKKLNFNDPRSKLFFEYVRLLKETKPKYFLLENVKMKKEHQDIITEYLGVEPVIINSSIVSPQNRIRCYWTNIPNITKPEENNIVLKDIVEKDLIKRENIKTFMLNDNKKTTIESDNNLTFMGIDKHKSNNGMICLGGVMGNNNKFWLDNTKKLQRNFSQGYRVYSENGKGTTLTANGGGIGGKTGLYEIDGVIRKLTRLECERMQTVPDNYTKVDGVSNNQAIKALGNGWTVDVIAHILKNIQ